MNFRSVMCVFFCIAMLPVCWHVYAPAGYNPKYGGKSDDVSSKIQKANDQIDELRRLIAGMKKEEKKEQKGDQQPQPKELQWNRYVTTNFEILSLDDAQGKYLCDNVEFIRTWILWRWGIKDVDFAVKCKVVCVPTQDLYEKLFNKKSPGWRVDKDGYTVWMITDGTKWNTRLPVHLTEIVLNNFEAKYNTKLPVWTHRGMSVLNGRIEDIRAALPLANEFSSSTLLTMMPDAYSKLPDAKKASFDAQAAVFCLWARQEHNGKVFLDFLGGSMVNPEYSLQYFNGLKTYADCDARVKAYLAKLPGGSDYYFTW